MNRRERDINSVIYLPACFWHPPRGGALLGRCQLSSPPAETYNSRLATLMPRLALSAWIKTQLAKGYGNCWLRESFFFIYLIFRNYVCGRILGGKTVIRGIEAGGVSVRRIKHWTNTARCGAVVSPLLRRMCVCFQRMGPVCVCVYARTGSALEAGRMCRMCLAWLSCELGCCSEDCWHGGQRCKDFFLLSRENLRQNHTTKHTSTYWKKNKKNCKVSWDKALQENCREPGSLFSADS